MSAENHVDTTNAMKNIAVSSAQNVDAYAGSVFDNPQAQIAWANMPEKTRQEYKEKGEQFYGMFDPSTSFGNMLKDTALDILSSIKSGMLISDLDEHEKELLAHVFGPRWEAKLRGELVLAPVPKVAGRRVITRRRKAKTKTHELTTAQRIKEERLAKYWSERIDGIFIEEKNVEKQGDKPVNTEADLETASAGTASAESTNETLKKSVSLPGQCPYEI